MLHSSADIPHVMDGLEARGGHTALIAADGRRIGCAALAAMADRFGHDLRNRTGLDRGLLVIEMRNTPEAVAAYVGALRARWPVILAADGATAPGSDLMERFRPDGVFRSDGDAWDLQLRPSSHPPHDLHPELAVMLSTSGSTGSTKLVRLSRTNIDANARAIAQYLQLDASRVAVTSLPAHYSYGLSVINSMLSAGGTVALTEASVRDPEFRAMLDRDAVTDIAGVPFTYDLLERTGFRDDPPPSLRVMTQAGGRLPPDLVRTYAAWSTARGVRFYVMYGQTEATARMAYLPPDRTLDHPDCIGVAIPGGSFALRADDGTVIDEPDRPGELIYRGPNVMMGYAVEPADLAAPPSLDALATGDIAARRVDGLYRIVGRASRFSKIAGLRIGFDEVEGILRSAGFAGQVTGDDSTLIVALSAGDPAAARRHVAATCNLPPTAVFAWHPVEMPVLASGKIDYPTIRRSGLALAATETAARAVQGRRSVARLFGLELNRADPDPNLGFAALGGDSLSYVRVSIALEEMIGPLPQGWEAMPISALQALADDRPADGTANGRTTLGTDVLLRLVAISLIFIGHGAPDWTEGLRGGSSILFALAGYSMAMVQLPQLLQGRVVTILAGVALRLVLPYFVLMTALLAVSDARDSVSWYLLGSVFEMTPADRGPLFSFWFIETLVHAIVLTCGLFLIPRFRTAMRDKPFPTLIALIALATLLRVAGEAYWPNGNAINLTLDGWLYVYLIGWAAFFARSLPHKVLVVVLAAVLAADQFGLMTGRPYWLVIAVAVLLAVPSVRVGRRFGRVLVHLAGATYFMYLAHALVVHVVHFEVGTELGPVAAVIVIYVASVGAGVLYAEGWRWAVNGVLRFGSVIYRAAQRAR